MGNVQHGIWNVYLQDTGSALTRTRYETISQLQGVLPKGELTPDPDYWHARNTLLLHPRTCIYFSHAHSQCLAVRHYATSHVIKMASPTPDRNHLSDSLNDDGKLLHPYTSTSTTTNAPVDEYRLLVLILVNISVRCPIIETPFGATLVSALRRIWKGQ